MRYLAVIILFAAAVYLTGCSSKPFDPQASYYQGYCNFDPNWSDADTAAYWAQLCEMYSEKKSK